MILMYLRLIWGEWATRVTGSISALLVLLGLSLNIAESFGARIPASSIVQLATWAVAVVCGVIASYSVWARERTARLSAEEQSNPIGLSMSFDHSPAIVISPDGGSYYAFFISVLNGSGVVLDRCILQLIIMSPEGVERTYPLCEPFSLLVDEHKEKPVVEYSPERDGPKGEPHLIAPIFWRRETDNTWVRESGGLVIQNHVGLVFEALSSATRAVRLRLVANFENDQWKFDVLS